MTAREKLERIHGYVTRYELVAERGEQRILIAYCMRMGRHTILTACQKHGQALIDFMGITDEQHDVQASLQGNGLTYEVAVWLADLHTRV